MMMSEFIERTGFEPMPQEYAKIEEAYYNFDGDKNAFCKAFVKADGEKQIYQARAAEIDRLNSRILELDRSAKEDGEEYERRLAALQAQLDKELEWQPHESKHNVSQADYEEGFKGISKVDLLTDDEAKELLSRELGFMPEKIAIFHIVNKEEINRHGQVRKTGEIERKSFYGASDWNYIRFDCAGWSYELFNGALQHYYQ